MIAAGDLLLAPARAEVLRARAAAGRDAVRIVAARFGAEAGMVGAGARARVRRPRRGRGAAERDPGRLVVCPTPIGNLEDVTLRVLAALRDADVVACEDTRRTRVLLERYGVKAHLVSYHEHNERRARPRAGRAHARRGRSVALVSDAGMPLVSDPGFVLVQALRGRRAGGGGAAGAVGGAGGAGGLGAAGRPLALRRLPAAQAGRARSCCAPETLVAFESPRRVAASLAVLAELDPERPVAVCRELTKVHEEVVRGTAAELAARYADAPPRGEVVLVVGPAPPRARRTSRPRSTPLRRLVDAGAQPRPAAAVVAELTGVPANALYRALTAEG